jgi:penicillin-binding protein 1A
VVVVDNASGGLRAVVGGRSFEESQFNRATQARRQVGSLFKPFVYAQAYERGLLPGTLVSDDPIRPGEIPWTPGHWSPGNADETFRGLQPAEFGLVKSRNTMSVRVGEFAGYDAVAEAALQAGLELPAERSPQLFIGNLGGTLQAVTSAYAAFANDGVRLRPHVITAVEDARGQILWRQVTPRVRVVSPASGWLVARDLEKVLAPGGTAASARAQGFTAPAGGKTGTTNDYTDAWFVGFTPELTCGVWVGLDRQRPIMDRGFGSTLALPVWTDVMRAAEANGYAPRPFSSAVSLARVELCRVSGQLATRSCRTGDHAYALDLPVELVPRDSCREHGLLHLGRPKERGEGGGWFGKIRGLFQPP